MDRTCQGMEVITLESNYDLIIIGAGPAGLAAGIYGGRAKLKTLILEKGAIGGRAYTTRDIVNYPGVQHISGPDLTRDMGEHAQRFGTEIIKEAVKSVDFSREVKTVKTRRHEYTAKAVIISTGTSARVLGIPGERELTGQGVAYCATCDAEFFDDQHVVVVGSGDQAIEESMFITKYASKVTIVVLHDDGVLDCNRQSAEKALSHPKIGFIWNSTLMKINGDDHVNGVQIKNSKLGTVYDYPCDGVFFFVGMIPATDFLKDQVPLSKQGWVVTNDRMETEVSGVFAVGDVRDKYLRQVATAVSDGATAAVAAERYIEELNDFEYSIVTSEIPVILAFWSPAFAGSLEAIMKVKDTLTSASDIFIDIDVSRKKFIASHFGITLSDNHTAAVIRVLKGFEIEALLP